MVFIRQNDLLFAYMVLTLVAGLSGNDRRVGGALLDHYNKKTGQCDPSGERIATLLGIERKTVISATKRLCDEFGFFKKVSHGGGAHRAKYIPQWDRFRIVLDDWNARMRSGDAPSTEAKTTHSKSRDLLTECNQNYSQTDRSNRSNKPIGADIACGDGAPAPERPAGADAVNRLSKGRTGPAFSARSPSHAEAAYQRAKKRLDIHIHNLGERWLAYVLEHINADMEHEAIAAEMRWHGGGVAFLHERLGDGFARGPPSAGRGVG